MSTGINSLVFNTYQWSHNFNRVSTSPSRTFLEFVFLLIFWTTVMSGCMLPRMHYSNKAWMCQETFLDYCRFRSSTPWFSTRISDQVKSRVETSPIGIPTDDLYCWYTELRSGCQSISLATIHQTIIGHWTDAAALISHLNSLPVLTNIPSQTVRGVIMVLILHWSSDSAFNHCPADQDLHILSVLLSGLGTIHMWVKFTLGRDFTVRTIPTTQVAATSAAHHDHHHLIDHPRPVHQLTLIHHPWQLVLPCPSGALMDDLAYRYLQLWSSLKPQMWWTSWHTRMQLCLIWSPKPCGCPPPRLVLSDGKVGNWKWLPQVGKIWPTGSKNTSGRLWEHLSWCVQPIFKERHDECMGETALVL